jgi:hypothetical protein
MGVKGGGKPRLFEERGWIAPLYLNMSSSIFLLVTLMTLLPSSIGGLMGLWEEQAVMPLPIKGLELCDESPLFSCGGLSGYPYCPPNEGCSPEPMVGTMNPSQRNPRLCEAERSQTDNRITSLLLKTE